MTTLSDVCKLLSSYSMMRHNNDFGNDAWDSIKTQAINITTRISYYNGMFGMECFVYGIGYISIKFTNKECLVKTSVFSIEVEPTNENADIELAKNSTTLKLGNPPINQFYIWNNGVFITTRLCNTLYICNITIVSKLGNHKTL